MISRSPIIRSNAERDELFLSRAMKESYSGLIKYVSLACCLLTAEC